MKIFRALSRCMLMGAIASSGCHDGTTRTTEVGTSAATIHGAIFTTLVDGTRVNANIFAAKTDVYLDGGPKDNAPAMAAALPEGDYFFQVTDPSGMNLLSTDHVSCRMVHVNEDGVFDVVYSGTNYELIAGTWTPYSCQHAQGDDTDQAALGALTVQLMPYLDTPNPGGEYKVWITPVDEYTGDPDFVPGPTDTDVHDVGRTGGNSHGFANSASKTDNFKVREPGAPVPICGDGILDEGEQCDDGNQINDDGCSSTCTIEPPPPVCGDGVVDEFEQCDDGNTMDGDGCSANCTFEPPPPCCGDGIKDSSEQCDDGNTIDGDGCSATCTIEPPPPPPCCGNGIIEAGETCDDGNTIGGDGCSSVCLLLLI